jgi:periodic tryptophan protein 1
MIPCVSWIRAGIAKQEPILFENEDDNNDEMNDGNDGEEKVLQFQFENRKGDDLDMDNYELEDGNPLLSENVLAFKDNLEDPYLVNDKGEDKELEDFIIKPTDMIILAAVSEDEEISHLDVFVFEKEAENMYIHHDYMLPSFPLCMAWFNYVLGSSLEENKIGNLVAIGTFEPYIEVWDLDVVDQPIPVAILGGAVNEDDFFSDNKNVELKPNSHKDSVLGLAWNRIYRNVLASCSADKTVKLWDLANDSCLSTYNIHNDKVQTLTWNPSESSILATGGFDKKVNILDVRNPKSVISTTLNGDVESLAWLPSPHHNHLLASDESGYLYCYDILKGLSQPVWYIQAHNKPCQSIAVNPTIPGFIATGSPEHDSPVKLWDISAGKPSLLYSETKEVGMAFSLNFSTDDPYYLLVGAKGTEPMIVNCFEYEVIQNKYGNQNWVYQEVNIQPTEPLKIEPLENNNNNQKSNNNNNNQRGKRGKRGRGRGGRKL